MTVEASTRKPAERQTKEVSDFTLPEVIAPNRVSAQETGIFWEVQCTIQLPLSPPAACCSWSPLEHSDEHGDFIATVTLHSAHS